MMQDQEEEGNVTEESEGENGEDRPLDQRDAVEPMKLGDTVEAHGVTWESRETGDRLQKRTRGGKYFCAYSV